MALLTADECFGVRNLHDYFFLAQDGVRKVCFHPTEPLLISASEDSTVKVWNLSNVANGPPSQRL